MPLTIESLEAEALQLSAADRARLVERLIASLDTDPEVEEAWAAEVERRHAEIENNIATSLPGAEALARQLKSPAIPRRFTPAGAAQAASADRRHEWLLVMPCRTGLPAGIRISF